MFRIEYSNLSKYFFIGLICLGSLLANSCVNKNEELTASPNIVLILSDDLGYGDLGSYNNNSLVPTPNLNKLASEGISFTNAYCPVSVCSPSRYALMTGTYPFRSWKSSGVMSNYEPSMIDEGQLTLPQMLQQSGYTTAGFGKWHLGATFPTLDGLKPAGFGKFKADNNGANIDLQKPISDGPVAHGFENWYGFSCASECWVMDGDDIVAALQHEFYNIDSAKHKEHIEIIPANKYLKRITEKSTQFLTQQSKTKKEAPFFLYFAPYVPHIPLSVSEEFKGTTKAGFYGDYVSELDTYIGKILNTLDSLGLAENTIILFASDNGSQFERTGVHIDNANPSNNLEDVNGKSQNPNEHHPNGNLKGSKWTIWEGGVRMPFIAKWPGKIPAGIKSDKIFALNDILATISSVIGFDLPKDAAIDSYDQFPNLMGEEKIIRESVVVQSAKNRMGFRKGNWKYVEPDNDELEGQLYNLLEDESESRNLIRENADVAEEMRKELLNIITGTVSEK
ncbi:arylsulfatase [Maribacter sp. ANRC-HE7]|uniref:Arylsulfatase n=1 Tax=Maribacter aquimaris TaxID=2737171 RepID=A0ABR7V5G2_9FLAO|nr:arylsulfatase [Maribacter aquimaris]MBD0780039.1 arylsulfatase [Maribacter aquimaris]